MGFIASFFCCSPETNSSNSQTYTTRSKQINNNLNPSNSHITLSRSFNNNQTNNNSNQNNIITSTNNFKLNKMSYPTSSHITTKQLKPVSSNSFNTKHTSTKTSHNNNNNANNTNAVPHSPDKDKIPRSGSTPVRKKRKSKNSKLNNSEKNYTFEDNEEDYDMLDSKDIDLTDEEVDDEEDIEKNGKQTFDVYNTETDRSTGNSSSEYAYSQQLSPHEESNEKSLSTENQNETTDINTNVNSASTLQENTESIPDQYASSDSNDANDANDFNMIPSYDDTEEFVDLTVLQPNQYHAPGYDTLLPPPEKSLSRKKCLVLDLDETLVHSSFKYLKSADFVLPVDIDDQIHNVYVIKRPGVDEFLKRVGEIFEVVVFTASVSRYGDPLLDVLDKGKSIHHRLFREACYNYEGNYIKNLSQLGRSLSDIIILDNSPASYIFHPQHAIPISSWFSDTHDNELLDIIPLLEDLSKSFVLDVGKVLDVSI